VPTQYTPLANSTYLDDDSYRSAAPAPTGAAPAGNFTFNVALVLDRTNDPTALLQSGWASRQQQLEALNENGTLWSTYGANPATYNQVLGELGALGIPTVNQIDPANGYVSSAAARTIWVRVDAGNFTTLFGPTATVKEGTDQSGNTTRYWDGNLSLPSELVAAGGHGLWFDTSTFKNVLPNPGSGPSRAAKACAPATSPVAFTALRPNQLGDTHQLPAGRQGRRRVPSAWSSRASVPPAGGQRLQELLDPHREPRAASSAPVSSVAGGRLSHRPPAPGRPASARDVGVVRRSIRAAAGAHAGSGSRAAGPAPSPPTNGLGPRKPARDQLVVRLPVGTRRVALPPRRQRAVHRCSAGHHELPPTEMAVGQRVGNGVTNVGISRTSGYSIPVGGTSPAPSTRRWPMRRSVRSPTPPAGDHATIWTLIAGGLTALPSRANGGATLVETVWNNYFVDGATLTGPGNQPGYLHNNASSGGVDPSQPTPSYQKDFGLAPITSDPGHLTGRGLPDVRRMPGGNSMFYRCPGDHDGGGRRRWHQCRNALMGGAGRPAQCRLRGSGCPISAT
jgi:hypothetical protein